MDVPATREHVIPAWARRSFDIHGPVTVDRREEPAAGPVVRVGKIQHLNITLDEAICKYCNTVWLSQLEREVRPFLAPMAASAKPTTLDSRLQALLATWAVKTVLLFELAMRQMYPGGRPIRGYLASPPELAWLRANREPPPRSLVWLGCWDCRQATPVMYAPSSAPLPAADDSPVAGHFATFALGYVGLQVFTVDFVGADQHRAASWNTKVPSQLTWCAHANLAAAAAGKQGFLAARGFRQRRLQQARNMGRRTSEGA
jgi:hypothetical protein